MKALIDIKTPAGKSLEGFPQEIINAEYTSNFAGIIATIDDNAYVEKLLPNPDLHSGDTITITIQPD